MSAPESVPPSKLDATHWLSQFLVWQLPLTLVVLVASAIPAAVRGTTAWPVLTVLTAAYVIIQLVAFWLVRAGQMRQAGVLVGVGLLALCLPAVLFMPEGWWAIALVPGAAVTIALPFCGRRTARSLIGAAWITTLFVLCAALQRGLIPGTNPAEILAMLAAGLVVVTLSLGRLWHYHAHLSSALSNAAHSRDELCRANQELATRTVELAARERRYRSISELTSDYVYSASVTSDGELVNEWITDAFTRITGYTPAELGHYGLWVQLFHPDDLESIKASVATASGGTPVSFEFRIVTKAGETRWLREYCLPERDEASGRVTRILGAAQDITEHKAAEAERLDLERRVLESQKLESLGVLAGGVAHDFNNLLTVIQGNTLLALDDLGPDAPARPQIERVELATRRAAELTRQMLAYAGKGRFVVQPLDLDALVDEMEALLTSSVSRSVQLQLRLARRLPWIEGDATQLRQVVMNLVINAIDALGEQEGVVTVSTAVRSVDAQELAGARVGGDLLPGRYVCLEVADTGCGMDGGTLARIFEPFFSTKFTGRGLGLAAVLGIVRSHGAALLVASTVGGGTTFTLLFPAHQQIVAQLPDAGPEASRAETGGVAVDAEAHEAVVLVVDDEDAVRGVTAAMLRSVGARTLTAADGPSAIDLFRRHQHEISCVLLDLTMPALSGERTMEGLLAIDPAVRVVLMSGYSEEEAAAHFGGASPIGFLQKPFTLDQVRAVVAGAALTHGVAGTNS